MLTQKQRKYLRIFANERKQSFVMNDKSRQNKSNLVIFVLLSYCSLYNDTFYLVGYTADDVTYKWTTGRGVNIASDMKLSQFDLISTPTGTETTLRNQGKSLLAYLLISCHFASIIILLYCYIIIIIILLGIHSTLIVSFHLQRHMGDFVIQVSLVLIAIDHL